jgi:hypothetical protein
MILLSVVQKQFLIAQILISTHKFDFGVTKSTARPAGPLTVPCALRILMDFGLSTWQWQKTFHFLAGSLIPVTVAIRQQPQLRLLR